MKQKLSILFLLCSAITGMAQVGINNPLPNPSTVLDLSGGANTGKGFLLPATNNPPVGITMPVNGLIVMDTTTREFYVYNSSSMKWNSANPWIKEYGVSEISTNTPVNITNSLTVAKAEVVTSLKGETEAAYIQDINGAVPPGVIVMWSGNIADIPYGWGLCDGSWYDHVGFVSGPLTVNYPASYTHSPNLEGRFIVGYDADDSEYDNVRPSQVLGGEKKHTLAAAEMPAHSHNFSGTTSTDGDHDHGSFGSRLFTYDKGNKDVAPTWSGTGFGGITNIAGDHSHSFSGTTSSVGSATPHENRPPYYTLAYIIKLKNHYAAGGSPFFPVGP